MKMYIEQISHTPEEYGRDLTMQHHQTLYYLAVNGHITPEVYNDLIETTFVAPVKNDPGLAGRLLNRLFSKTAKPTSYTFPIVSINNDPRYSDNTNPTNPTKPTLKLITDKNLKK